jgi:uncharacterized protein (DUF2141 family)
MPFTRSLSVVLLAIGLLVLQGTSAWSVLAQEETSTLTVNISGFRNAKGKADALLFVRPNGFPDDDSKAVDKDEVSIDPRTMSAQVVFKEVAQGFAAVIVLHDENMNRKIDKNFLGIPKEGYGTSNNPRKASHNPRWDEAKFQVTRPQEEIQIKLIYW